MITLILITTLAISSCGGGPEVSEREEYWKSETGAFFQSPRSLDEVFAWLRERDINPSFDGDVAIINGSLSILLDSILLQSAICDDWEIWLILDSDDSKNVSSYSISKSGDCF